MPRLLSSRLVDSLSPLASMNCRRAMRRSVRVLFSWDISVISPLRWMTLSRLPQPFQARTMVSIRTVAKPSVSFLLTPMFANQLFMSLQAKAK